MLRAPRWWWRIAIALVCVASAGGLFVLAYSDDRFRALSVGSTTVEFACVSGLLVIVPMTLNPMTDDERTAAIDALGDEIAVATKEKRRIDAAISAADDNQTSNLLAEAVATQFESERLIARWMNLAMTDKAARGAARENITRHLSQRTTPTRNGPLFERVPGFRDQKAYLVTAWVPVTTLAAGLLPLTTASVKSLRMRRRRRRGRCDRCNYELQGLPEPRCPECGAAFARPTA